MSAPPGPVAASDTAPGARTWSVAGLLLAVADALAARLGAVQVRGELSGFQRAASGHCYFSLKDADSQGQPALLRCAMFRRAAGLLDFAPRDGQQVELRGRLTLYEPRGELQLVVEAMRPLGAGTLYELFLRLRARLAADGLFDAQRKRPLPAWPQAVGVVTSRSAAALHDVLSALRRRAPHLPVIVYPSAVQGADAPAQLVQALRLAGDRAEVSVLIVCRGGGSLEDLWAFNDEAVVRAVAASAIPVVCGVGHETDVTLAELAADLRAPTPTAAAELCAPRRDQALAQLQALAQGLGRALRRRLEQQAQRLDRLALQMGRPTRALAAQSLRLQSLQARQQQALRQTLAQHQRRLQLLAPRLQQALRFTLQHHTQQLAQLGWRLQALDPGHVLARGYAWLADADGLPVTQVAALQAGQRLRGHWADGAADLTVQALHPRAPGLAAPPAAEAATGPGSAPEARRLRRG